MLRVRIIRRADWIEVLPMESDYALAHFFLDVAGATFAGADLSPAESLYAHGRNETVRSGSWITAELSLTKIEQED